MTTLEERLVTLTKKIASPWKEKIHNAVAHYLIFRKVRTFKERLSFLVGDQRTEDIYETIITSFREKITFDYDVQRLWKAIVYCTKRGVTFDIGAKHFRVLEKDLRFLWDKLTLEDVAEVQELVATKILLDPISGQDMAYVTKALERHAKAIATRRLSFVAKFDPSQGLDDLAMTLLVRGLATVRCYDYMANDFGKHDLPKILNYARSAITNYAIDMIKHHTDASRARVVNTGDAVDRPCSVCPAIVPADVLKCASCGARPRTAGNSEYRMTTVSLDCETCDDDSNLHDVVRSDVDLHLSVEQSELFHVLQKKLSSKENAFVRILIGEHSDKFSEWLWVSYRRTVEAMTKEDLRSYAAMYLQEEEPVLTERVSEVLIKAAVVAA